MEYIKSGNALWVFNIEEALKVDVRAIALSLHRNQVSVHEFKTVTAQFVHVLNRVIDSGFEFYYGVPSKNDDSLSPMVKRTVDSIVATIRHAIHLVVKRVFKNMPLADVKIMAYYLDSMVVSCEKGNSYLAFPLPEKLGKQLSDVMDKVADSETIESYSDELTQVFSDIVWESAHYYYHLPIQLIKINGFAKKAADIGIDSTVKGTQKIIRRIVKDVSHKEVELLFKDIHVFLLIADLDYPVCSGIFFENK